MKVFLYVVMILPILITGSVFAWVVKGERALVKSMDVPLPSLGTPVESEDEMVVKGHRLFNEKGCVYCHGPNAAGGVKNNNAQGGEVPGLTKVGEGYTEEELAIRIKAGVSIIGQEDVEGPHPPLAMPAWKGHITDDELEAIIAYLMSMAPESDDDDDDF